MEDYFEILKVLSAENIQYVTIGTWALKFVFPEVMSDYQINDCDLIIKNDIQHIQKAIKVLKSKNWKVSVWEIEVDDTVNEQFLIDKYYLRAKQGKLILDITYECPFISWHDLLEERTNIEGFFIASLNHILKLKQIKGSEKDLEVISRFSKH